jgi:hypothetical protein
MNAESQGQPGNTATKNAFKQLGWPLPSSLEELRENVAKSRAHSENMAQAAKEAKERAIAEAARHYQTEAALATAERLVAAGYSEGDAVAMAALSPEAQRRLGLA